MLKTAAVRRENARVLSVKVRKRVRGVRERRTGGRRKVCSVC